MSSYSNYGYEKSYEKRVSRYGNVYFAPVKSKYDFYEKRGEWMPETNLKAIKDAYNEQKGSDYY